MKFYQGLEVRFNEHFGKINYICNFYVTLTLENTDTNLLIYSENWNQIYLLNGNRNENK